MAASYISVPRDLTKVKSKVMFNLTKRQLICFGLAALVGVPSFFLLKLAFSISTSVMIMMVIMMPFFFLAMYEKHGQPLEVFLGHFIEANFTRPKVRPYKTNNYYAVLQKQVQLEMEVERIVRDSKEDVPEGGAFGRDAKESDKGTAVRSNQKNIP